jgi:hypothetical protein
VGEGTWILPNTFQIVSKWSGASQSKLIQHMFVAMQSLQMITEPGTRNTSTNSAVSFAEELNKQLPSNQCVAVRRKCFIEGLKGVWSDVKGDELQPLHLIRQLYDHIDTNFGRNNLPISYTYWR